MKAQVRVRLKEEVLDPQGDAVRRALSALGFEGVKKVRIGKLIEIELEGDHPDVKGELATMCEKLLANPVIEDFQLDVE